MRGLQWIGIFTRSEEKMGNSDTQAGDEETKKGARKALFKRTTAIADEVCPAVLPPRKNAPAKPGKCRGGGDGARQTKDEGPLNPKLSSSKPLRKYCGGVGVFRSFLSISYMNILFLGFGGLWHWVGRLVCVFLVYLVLVLCWNKFGAFDVSCISHWIWLIWTVRDLVFWNPKMDHGRSLQMWSLVSSNRRRPHRALVGFGHGGHQRVVGYRDSFGLGYGVQKLYGGRSRCFNGILYGIRKNNESQETVGD
ncbi:hypothetical protein HID58_085963 [Brassica napus]|uniref:Uncharacterized protein n=1 Tax=Brassica napus TaxID=3708 RepID=A0ABQ7XP50_BRANA|nr:hypothetical protein HID58_085963 [Brassica napus]